MKMNFGFILNFTFAVVCLIHVASILNNFINPANVSVKFYDQKLEDIEFPMTFSVCIDDKNENEKFQALGYENVHSFYQGQSRHNKSLYGWSGHTEEGLTMMNAEGNIH